MFAGVQLAGLPQASWTPCPHVLPLGTLAFYRQSSHLTFFTEKPRVAAFLPSSCHIAVGFAAAPPELRIPPNSVCRQGVPTNGASGSGKLGSSASGGLKFSAQARFCTSLLASRGVKGAKPQRHSINFNTDV